MRTLTKVTVALAAAIMLTGCVNPENHSGTKSSCADLGMSGETCAVTIEYKDAPLDCISWIGSHGEYGYDCNWEKYNSENPR